MSLHRPVPRGRLHLSLVLCLTGCADQTPPLPDGSAYARSVTLTTLDHQRVLDPMIVRRETENILRLDFEPGDAIPAALDGRMTWPPDDWEFALWIGDDDATDVPVIPVSFARYSDGESPQVISGTITVGRFDGDEYSVQTSHVAAPTTQLEGHVYRHLRLPVGLPSGTHRARLMAFPTADPSPVPQPGLVVGARTLGPPVLLLEFAIEVPAVE